MVIRRLRWSALSATEREQFVRRSEEDIAAVRDTVEPIIAAVRLNGDAALREFTKRFDGADVDTLPLQVQAAEFAAAAQSLDAPTIAALRYAVENVRQFHRFQQPPADSLHPIAPGVMAGERVRPIESVALYVPHGRGSFPSMLYMLAVPAMIAGVRDICVLTPPNADGSVDAACLYAAQLCGITKVFRVGGAQAIAAVAYGTQSLPRVQKVVGPGSAYVTAAKRLLSERLDPGPAAGPTDAMIWADATAEPRATAWDLMIEAEHGEDSAAVLVTDSPALADAVTAQLHNLLAEIPELRRHFVATVFSRYGGIVEVDSFAQGAAVVNAFAPEHVQIRTRDPWAAAALVQNAGEILIGEYSAFSLANYAAGANAVLPTGGKARTGSPVSVRDFVKTSSIVHVSRDGFAVMQPHVVRLAEYEGFFCHANALKAARGPAQIAGETGAAAELSPDEPGPTRGMA